MSTITNPATTTDRRVPSILRALRHRNFRLFCAGQVISLSGTWMQSVALSWLIYRLTGSAVLLGLVGFASQIPVFLMAPVGGAVADRGNRHRILIIAQTAAMIFALLLAALTFTGSIEIWHIFTVAAILGLVNAFALPAQSAFVVDMVGREDLMNAVALNSSMVNGARIVGPALAGVLVAAVGEAWCFLLNGVSYIAVIAGLLMMKLPGFVARPRTGTTVENIKEGFRFVWSTTPVRALVLLLGIVSLMGAPYAVLMPIFADRILGGGASSLGILMGATGLGALIGALTLAARKSLVGIGRWVAVATGGFGLFLILFSFSETFWLSVALLVPVGFCMMFEMASSNTLVQSMVPDRLRGRVMSVYQMMFMGMAPLGALMAGGLAENIGPQSTVALGGGVAIIGAIIFAINLPTLRPIARELIIAIRAAGGEPPEEVTGQPQPGRA